MYHEEALPIIQRIGSNMYFEPIDEDRKDVGFLCWDESELGIEVEHRGVA